MRTQDERTGTFPARKAVSPIHSEGAFARQDETDDALFYETDRFVSHLDSLALKTVKALIGRLVIEERPVILDLMAGWDSHLPESLEPSAVIGLGLNPKELASNKALTRAVIHDVNKNPQLPFAAATFDAVINTVSVDYMTQPVRVFQEVGRILKPGGLFLVIFSNRMFPQKAVRVWSQSGEAERVLLVEEFFQEAGAFEKARFFASQGKPRPSGDKYVSLEIPSDPVYAVYADRKGVGASSGKKRPVVTRLSFGARLEKETLEKRKAAIKETLRCPYCETEMKKWAVPDNPFCQTWDNDFMYICFNDGCPYYVRGWDHMTGGGNHGVSYRLMYNPEKDCCMPIPVQSPRSLKEGIMA